METLPGEVGTSVESYFFLSDLIMVCISIELERCCVIYFTLMALINGFLKSKGRLQSYVKCSGGIKPWNTERKTAGWVIESKRGVAWQEPFFEAQCDSVWLVDWIRLMWLVAVLQFPVIDSINKTVKPGILICTESNDKCVMREVRSSLSQNV